MIFPRILQRGSSSVSALEVFERQVLLFPVIVLLFANIALFCGGQCAEWQWWIAVSVVLGVPFLLRSPSKVLLADSFFVLLLLILKWWLPPMNYDTTGPADMPTYHLPMVRLLIEGWNPVLDPSAEGIVNKLGLDLWGMHPLHVAFLSKALAIFSAVAYTFIKDPYALTFPCVDFLWLGVGLMMVRIFKGPMRLVGIIVASRFCHYMPVIGSVVEGGMFVDVCMGLASVGLIFTMYDDLRHDSLSVLQLVVFSVWMMNAKLTGLLCAFVCWGVFAGVMIWRHRIKICRMLMGFMGLGILLILLLAAISYIPLGTSWRMYGHPLYPYMTIDESKHPIKDISWEFSIRNNDAKSMGRIGMLLNAYLSPALTRKAYNWYLGRSDFSPWCHCWQTNNSPTTMRDRIQIWMFLVACCLVPSLRIFGVMGSILLCAFPGQAIGEMRYQPWVAALEWLSLCVVLEEFFIRTAGRMPRLNKSMHVLVWFILGCVASHIAIEAGSLVDVKIAESKIVSSKIYAPYDAFCDLFDSYSEEIRAAVDGHVVTFKRYTPYVNNAVLLMRETGRAETCEVRSFANDDEARFAMKNWYHSMFGYLVPNFKQVQCLQEQSPRSRLVKWGQMLKSAIHAWFITYPKLIFGMESLGVGSP